MEVDLTFYEKIVDGWERTETENGVPYFVNHITECTSWDHPYWTKIVEDLREQDTVKYAAYRTALKIQHLQKNLQLHNVDIYTLHQGFEELGYPVGSWEPVSCTDLATLLLGIFTQAQWKERRPEETEMLADLNLNFLLNLFDKDKTGAMSVMSAKIVLYVLSSSSLKEKYRYLYQEIHDPSTYIGTRALATLIQAIMKVPEFIQESYAFGRTPEPAVASCVQMGTASGGITEDVFYRWLQKEPQTLVWIPTLHRLQATQNVSHDVKCNVCKKSPIVGFRYKCLKCFNFNLCQSCFFTGKTKKNHKTKHPTQEYCVNSTAKDDTAAFMKTLRNNLGGKQRRKSNIKYLPIEADNQYTNLAWSPGKEGHEDDIHADISETARRLAELEMVESQTQTTPDLTPVTIHVDLEHVSPISPKDDSLQEQRDELNAIIVKLKEENRALYDQLASLQDHSESGDSNLSDNPHLHTEGHMSNIAQHSHLQSAFKAIQNNRTVREPLPCETTPIYLSVPIYKLPGSHGNILSSSPKPNQGGTFPQPDFSTPDSRYSPYSTHSSPRETTVSDSLDALDCSPAKFSLPSPEKSYDEFNCEEAELRDIVNNAGNMFPKDLSFSRPLSSGSAEEDEMLRAANSITMAMSEFVNQAVNPMTVPALDLIMPEHDL